MRLRDFIKVIAGSTVVWPLVTRDPSLPIKFQELGYITLHVGQTMRMTNNGIR